MVPNVSQQLEYLSFQDGETCYHANTSMESFILQYLTSPAGAATILTIVTTLK